MSAATTTNFPYPHQLAALETVAAKTRAIANAALELYRDVSKGLVTSSTPLPQLDFEHQDYAEIAFLAEGKLKCFKEEHNLQ